MKQEQIDGRWGLWEWFALGAVGMIVGGWLGASDGDVLQSTAFYTVGLCIGWYARARRVPQKFRPAQHVGQILM